MIVLRTIAVTFAQYSRIPMPRFEWKDKDMRYSMAAFPLVGVVTGLLWLLLYGFTVKVSMPAAASALLLAAVPLIVTGGFHLDGFMDVADAVNSYGSREDKLRILKDPHIGAFSVIRLLIAGSIYIASLIIILDSDKAVTVMYTLALGFALSRSLSALSVLTFKSAKNEGMLYYEATSAKTGRNTNLVMIAVWIALLCAAMVFTDRLAGLLAICAAALSFLWYRHLSYKQFGGITGDTAGYFVVICEVATAAAGAAAVLISHNA